MMFVSSQNLLKFESKGLLSLEKMCEFQKYFEFKVKTSNFCFFRRAWIVEVNEKREGAAT